MLALLAAIIVCGTFFPQLGGPIGGVRAAEPAAVEPNDARFFPETEHYISGRFREFWDTQGGLFVFGYPLTNVFSFPSTDGKTYQVQYFERAVFELHPENAAPYDVLLTQVGRELANARTLDPLFQPVARSRDPQQTFFPETGHNVGPTFLDYWKRFGGLPTFGYPISELLTERNANDGKEYQVQYFERARFEYHPEQLGTDYAVLLGQLGRERMIRVGVPAAAQAAEPPPVTAPPPGVFVTERFSSTGYPFLIGPKVGLGIQAQYFGQPLDRLTGMVNDIGFTWTKQQIIWRDVEVSKGRYEWGQLDEVVDTLNRANIRVMLSVVKSPRWATPAGLDDGTPLNSQDFGDFMRAIATRYKGKVIAYEIWNEENLAAETGNRINPAFYVQLLKAGYLGVKGIDPGAIVVLGALSPTGVNNPSLAVDDLIYLDQLYKVNGGEIKNYFDVLGSHPYGMANPPDTLWSEGKPGPEKKFYNHDSFYFRRFEQQYAIMQQYGDGDKQIWLSEWGWGSDFRPDGYQEFNTVTEEMRAKYVTDAILQMRQKNPYMGVTFLWNLNWSIIGNWYDGPSHYSIINPDYSKRPVYDALKRLPKDPR
ncbi:MAG TPA: hypothetical protein VIL85_07235 [Thermomicrobiales bacterium]|jgi:hypothetical protein